METLAQFVLASLKKVPALSWFMICLCMMTYTGTLCVVMLRSSEVNVTVNGMSMAMTQAASVQESAAADLEAAAKTIAALKKENEVLQQKLAAKPEFFPQQQTQTTRPSPMPAPIVTTAIPEEVPEQVELQTKAASLRRTADQMTKHAAKAAPMLAPMKE